MKEPKEEYVFRNYGSESVDITRKCCEYLLENNFHRNDEKKNIALLEQALINYSVLKLAEWNPNYEKLEIENWDNLSILLEALNNEIPLPEVQDELLTQIVNDKEGFFNQYTHCILNIYASIKKENPIVWRKEKNPQQSYTYIMNNGILTEIITKESVPSHEIPIKILEKIKH